MLDILIGVGDWFSSAAENGFRVGTGKGGYIDQNAFHHQPPSPRERAGYALDCLQPCLGLQSAVPRAPHTPRRF
jgi:hypothetical protein